METRSTASPANSADDFARRLDRAAREATEAGLAGILATPGPDLLHLTGYAPAVGSDRFTMLGVQEGAAPTLLVPSAARLEAAQAPGAGALTIIEWSADNDPFLQFAPVLEPSGRYAISDEAWAVHLLGLQRARPTATFRPMSTALPALHAQMRRGGNPHGGVVKR